MARGRQAGPPLQANSDVTVTKVTKDGGRRARRAVTEKVTQVVEHKRAKTPKARSKSVRKAPAASYAAGGPPRTKRRVVRESPSNPTFDYTEYLGSVWGPTTAFTKVIDVPLNPGYGLVYKQSQQEASVYEKFQILKCKLRYHTRTSTGNSGEWIGYVDFDPADAPATAIANIPGNKVTVGGAVWESSVQDLGGKMLRKGTFFVHMGTPETTTAESRQDNPGILRIYLERPNTPSSMGYFTLQWTIKWSCRRSVVPTVLSLDVLSARARATIPAEGPGPIHAMYCPVDLSMQQSDGFTGTDLWQAPPTLSNVWESGLNGALNPLTQVLGYYKTDGATADWSPHVTASNLSVVNGIETTPTRTPAGASVIALPPGDWRLSVSSSATFTKNSGGDLTFQMLYALYDPATPTSPTATLLSQAVLTASGGGALPGAGMRSMATLSLSVPKFLTVFFRFISTAAVNWSVTEVNIAASVTRNTTSGLDLTAPLITETFTYPEQAAQLEAALADFKGVVVLGTPPKVAQDPLEAMIDRRLRLMARDRNLAFVSDRETSTEEKESVHSFVVP